MAINATCNRCGYNWDYTGDLVQATCPSCNAKVTVRDLPNNGND